MVNPARIKIERCGFDILFDSCRAREKYKYRRRRQRLLDLLSWHVDCRALTARSRSFPTFLFWAASRAVRHRRLCRRLIGLR